MEYFNPLEIEDDIHIVGLGAIGSNLALMLARLGLTNIHLYDFDTVEPINVANQNYFQEDIGKTKLETTIENMQSINPDIELYAHEEGWKPKTLMSGYIFLCLDNIEVRRAIVEEQKSNPYILAILDFRMGLDDAQHYMAKGNDQKAMCRLLETMDFTHEEAKKALPVSACGTSLSILPTIWTVISAGTANFINFCKKKEYKHTILVNPFSCITDSF